MRFIPEGRVGVWDDLQQSFEGGSQLRLEELVMLWMGESCSDCLRGGVPLLCRFRDFLDFGFLDLVVCFLDFCFHLLSSRSLPHSIPYSPTHEYKPRPTNYLNSLSVLMYEPYLNFPWINLEQAIYSHKTRFIFSSSSTSS